jgi:hypothetical protein
MSIPFQHRITPDLMPMTKKSSALHGQPSNVLKYCRLQGGYLTPASKAWKLCNDLLEDLLAGSTISSFSADKLVDMV